MRRMIAVLSSIMIISNIALAAGPGSAGNAEAGHQFWTKQYTQNSDIRSCASCHTANPRQSGKHVRTGKSINPLSPAVNTLSLTDPKKIEKWFRRNCKWTLGRECTADEKSDVLAFLKSF
jgi:hypothetical protein